MSGTQIVSERPQRRSLWPFIHFVPRQTHFNFVGLAPYAAVLSVLLVIGSGASLFLHGAKPVNFGVDFVGGTKLEVTTAGAAPLAQIRSDLAAHRRQRRAGAGRAAPNGAADPVQRRDRPDAGRGPGLRAGQAAGGDPRPEGDRRQRGRRQGLRRAI